MEFPISIPCPNCKSKLKIKEKAYLGRTVACPKCGEKFRANAPVTRDDVDFDLEPPNEKLPPPRPKRKAINDESTATKAKKKSKKSSKNKSSSNLEMVIGGGVLLVIGLGVAAWMAMGRVGPPPVGNANGNAIAIVKNASADQFSQEVATAPAVERPYLLGAKPFLDAIVSRNYAAVFRALSSHARASIRPEQFVVPREENHVAQPLIKDITEDQLAEWMKKMESARGIPQKIRECHVHSMDKKILSGQGDPIDTMFAIGGMPKEIPTDIRKASIRVQIECNYSDEQVKKIAKLMNITEEQVRTGKIYGDEEENDPDDKPYFNLKFVLIEEGGELKVGYFEFMPPSMLD